MVSDPLLDGSAVNLDNTPFLATHQSQDSAWVDFFFIPRIQRRQGVGRRIFEAWVATLPKSVRTIYLVAAELDEDSPLEFWTKMGFEVDEPYVPERLLTSYMVKRLPDENDHVVG